MIRTVGQQHVLRGHFAVVGQLAEQGLVVGVGEQVLGLELCRNEAREKFSQELVFVQVQQHGVQVALRRLPQSRAENMFVNLHVCVLP